MSNPLNRTTKLSEAGPDLDPVVVNAVLIAVRQAANLLCDRWTLLILLSAHSGVERFADFRDRFGIANRLLSRRLELLIEQGVIQREAYMQRPLRHAYCLTDMGLELFDAIAMMLRWEQQWGDSDPGLVISHKPCARSVTQPIPHCIGCDAAVSSPYVTDLRINQQEIRAMPPKATAYRRSSVKANERSTSHPIPLSHCIEIFGDKWTIELIMSAFVRVRTFGGFQTHTGISTNILSDRLARLTASGILKHNANARSQSRRSYHLTSKGIDLFSILVCIETWADRWQSNRKRSPMHLVHQSCGQELKLAAHCNGCQQPLLKSESEIRLG